MANRDCEIARDLMPLVIDEAASEESKAYVKEHLAGCEECGKVYAEMQSATSAPAKQDEADAAYADSMRRISRRRRIRRVWIAALALAVVFFLTIGGLTVYDRLATRYSQPVSYERIAAALYQMPAGKTELAVGMKKPGDALYSWQSGYSGDVSRATLTFSCWEPKIKSMSKSYGREGTILDWQQRLWTIDGQLYRIATRLSYRDGEFEWD